MSRSFPRRHKWVSLIFIVFVLLLAAAVYEIYISPTAEETPESAAPSLPSAKVVELTTPFQATRTSGERVSTPSSKPVSTGARPPFDFYVLALSWSPDYCATDGKNDTQQCSIGKKLGFVLHGLWPNFEKGYPQSCSTQKLPDQVEAKFPNLYPSQKLYDHEWEKHGTCSGLSPEQYLTLSATLKSAIQSPPAYQRPQEPFRTTSKQLKNEFIAVNPSLSPDNLAVNCSDSGRFLSEVYVCFTPEGKPRNCSSEVLSKAQKSCDNPDFLVRNVR